MKVLVEKTTMLTRSGPVQLKIRTIHERVDGLWIMRTWQTVIGSHESEVYKIECPEGCDGQHKHPIGYIPIRVKELTPYTKGRMVTVIDKD